MQYQLSGHCGVPGGAERQGDGTGRRTGAIGHHARLRDGRRRDPRWVTLAVNLCTSLVQSGAAETNDHGKQCAPGIPLHHGWSAGAVDLERIRTIRELECLRRRFKGTRTEVEGADRCDEGNEGRHDLPAQCNGVGVGAGPVRTGETVVRSSKLAVRAGVGVTFDDWPWKGCDLFG